MEVQHLDALVVSEDLHASFRRLVDRFAETEIVNGPRWQPVVDQLDLGLSGKQAIAPGTLATSVVVGWPADILKHARVSTDAFGFVVPVAMSGRRGRSWRDDTTIGLWRQGWSPMNIDRILVSTGDETVEFVIGDARLIPEKEAVDPSSR